MTTTYQRVNIGRYSSTRTWRHYPLLRIPILSYPPYIPFGCHWPRRSFNYDIAVVTGSSNLCDLMIIHLIYPCDLSIHWTTLYSFSFFIVSVYMWQCRLLLLLLLNVDCLSFGPCIDILYSFISLVTNESIRLNHEVMACTNNFMNLCLIQMVFLLDKLLMDWDEAISLLANPMIINEWGNNETIDMGIWKRFMRCYTWSLVWRYHYLSSLLLWIYKHLSRAVWMLCLQGGRSRIKIILGLNSSRLLLFLQWWIRRGILWKWPWLFDEVLLDILVCRDIGSPVSFLHIHSLRHHGLDQF